MAGLSELGVLVKRELPYDRDDDLVGLDGFDLTFNDGRIHHRELCARRLGPLSIDQHLRRCGIGRLRNNQVEAAGAQSEAYDKQEREQSSLQHPDHVYKGGTIARRGTRWEICNTGGI